MNYKLQITDGLDEDGGVFLVLRVTSGRKSISKEAPIDVSENCSIKFPAQMVPNIDNIYGVLIVASALAGVQGKDDNAEMLHEAANQLLQDGLDQMLKD